MRSIHIVLLIAFTIAVSGTVWEAELGRFQGGAKADRDGSDFTGTGYVDNLNKAIDGVQLTLNGKAGLYSLVLRYRSLFDAKRAKIEFNGAPAGEIDLPKTTGWTKVNAPQLLFKEGQNTLTVLANWGYWDLDNVETNAVAPPPKPVANGLPVDRNLTSEGKVLLKLLQKNFGNKVLSGQQELEDAKWLQQNVGKLPAVVGFDFMDYSPSRVARGAKSQAVEQAIQWDQQGGIVTFVWHWNAPTGLIDTPGKEWYKGFYTDATTFDVKQALAEGANGANYKLLIRDIDAIAVQLKRLRDAKVPVLFRPLHEAEGAWFWWGAKGAAPCVQLYQILFNRIVRYHQIHNLIWVWNSVAKPWYVGDTYTDVNSFDSYPSGADHSAQSDKFRALVSLGANKLIALGEVGPVPSPDSMFSYNAIWSYFVIWNGFQKDATKNDLPFLKTVFNDPRVLSLGEIKGWKTGSVPITPKPTPKPATPKPTTPSGTCAPMYGQCGGSGWTGATCCSQGTCKPQNQWYSQCS